MQLYKEHIKLFCFALRTAELESVQFNYLITRKSKTLLQINKLRILKQTLFCTRTPIHCTRNILFNVKMIFCFSRNVCKSEHFQLDTDKTTLFADVRVKALSVPGRLNGALAVETESQATGGVQLARERYLWVSLNYQGRPVFRHKLTTHPTDEKRQTFTSILLSIYLKNRHIAALYIRCFCEY